MPDPITALGGAQFVSGVFGANAASDAADAQTRASQQGIEAQERGQERAMEFVDPFRQTGLAVATPILQSLGIEVPQSLLTAQNPEIQNLQSQISNIDAQLSQPSALTNWKGRAARARAARGGYPGNLNAPQIDREGLQSQRSELQSQLDTLMQAQPQQAVPQENYFNQELEQINPLVSFLRDEGFEDIQESAAAGGRLRSGGALEDLTRFNTQIAATVAPQLQQQRFNQLFNVLGLGANAASGQASQQLQTASNIGNLLGASGAAQAQGILGANQAVQGTIGGLSGLYGAQQAGLFNQPPSFSQQEMASLDPYGNKQFGYSGVGDPFGGF